MTVQAVEVKFAITKSLSYCSRWWVLGCNCSGLFDNHSDQT